MKSICSVAGCENKGVRRGWCPKHYQRWRKYGDPLGSAPLRPLRPAPNKSGLCFCGCGAKTKIAKSNNATRGNVKGEALRYCYGHGPKHGVPRRMNFQFTVTDLGFSTPCWIWNSRLNTLGYPLIQLAGKQTYAHRVVFAKLKEPLVKGMDIDHLCRHPACINPDHLEQVTHAENIRRAKSTRLAVDAVRRIRYGTEAAMALSRELKIDLSHIYKIRNRRKWRGI